MRWADRAREGLCAPVDLGSLVAFRVMFGLLMFGGTLRFFWNDWIDRFFVQPTFFFKYWGFSWVNVAPEPVMYGVFVAMALSAAAIAAGWYYRVAVATFWVLFTYVELLDVSNYLNHYYLVSLLAGLLFMLPAHRQFSMDVWRGRVARCDAMPAWMLIWLRAQVGCVYVFAALAKFSTDWLVHAQPLHIWLAARSEMPVFGALLENWHTALAMSWGGFLFDLTIVAWLLWPRTRVIAYCVLLGFHAVTSHLFSIGMFPWIMAVCATVFFSPSWPRRGGKPTFERVYVPAFGRPMVAVALVWMAVQITLPWRHLAYPGSVAWNELGMRWSWKVMVREKNGDVSYRVRVPGRERDIVVSPRRHLVGDQEREFSAQPDLIVQLGQHIGRQHAARHGSAEVFVDAWVSWNGRRAARLIDPDVDLMTMDLGLAAPNWILPEPTENPPRREQM